MGNASLSIDIRHSKTPLLKRPIIATVTSCEHGPFEISHFSVTEGLSRVTGKQLSQAIL